MNNTKSNKKEYFGIDKNVLLLSVVSFVNDLSSEMIMPILLYVLFNIFYALFAIPFGLLSDKIGRRKVIIFGYFIYSLTAFGFAYFNSLKSFIALFALYGRYLKRYSKYIISFM